MTKPPVAVISIVSVFALASVYAGETGEGGGYSRSTTTTSSTSVYDSAEREVARRQEAMRRAEEAIAKGDKAMKDRDYEVAVSQYKYACDQVPESPETHRLRAHALHGFCEASCALAKQRIAEGRYQDAENVLTLVTGEQYDPHCREALVILAQLEDPEYYNKTITPKFRANVEEVKKLFIEAEGFYNTGRYDMAFRRYEQILNIDPYNIAARKGQEKVNLAKDNYAVQGYDHTRSLMVYQVDKAWDRPVRRFGVKGGGIIEGPAQDIRNTAAIEAKLNRIIIPKVEFKDATVRSAVDFLKAKSRDLDPETDPSKPKGVNIVLKLDTAPGAPAAAAVVVPAAPAIPGLETPATPVVTEVPAAPAINPAEARITLALANVPLMEVLRYITSLSNLKIKIDPYAVAIVPASEPTDALYTKEYKVPPGFIGSVPGGGGGESPLAAPAAGTTAGDAKGAGNNIAGRAKARDFLEGQGVTFPPGASATYSPTSSRLVVRNTQSNLDLIDNLVDITIGEAPRQVEIEAKFVEITQNNLKELSFDWLVGPFNVPGTDPGQGSPPGKVLVGGGTASTTAGSFPFSTSGLNSITGGNRSGNLAISSNAIDALLFPSGALSGAAPALLGVAGTLTDPQFQVVVRALNQKKGVDLLSAPRVTTKSGQRAVIEIIREFRYPTEFDPPQIPQTVGGSTSFSSSPTGAVTGGGSGAFPVTPTTPTAFETRNTGVTLEVEPTVGPDGYTIDLNLVPQVVEFEGFINYGSPIKTVSPLGLLGSATGTGTSSVTLTDNVINQPIFSSRKVTTSVTIWDGQTVVIGGLIREDVQKIEDKTPFFGDLPLFGRLFRSSVDQHLKRNLIIFVSARLINPAGEAILQDDEKDEVVEPLALPEIAPPALPEVPPFAK